MHRLLDAEADNPALRAARRSLLATVAVAAGQATFDDPASVERRGRCSGSSTPWTIRATDEHRPSRLAQLLRRLWDGGPAPDPFPWAA